MKKVQNLKNSWKKTKSLDCSEGFYTKIHNNKDVGISTTNRCPVCNQSGLQQLDGGYTCPDCYDAVDEPKPEFATKTEKI